MAKNDLSGFDPNGPALSDTMFGLPYDETSAELVILPVPWDVTVSYTAGTANGPAAIKEASKQVDLYLQDIPDAWKNEIWMAPVSPLLEETNIIHRKLAVKYLDQYTSSPAFAGSEAGTAMLKNLNQACGAMNDWVYQEARKYLEQGRKVGVLGGDHSTPLGLIRALAEKHEFSVLHIDAHFDLRKAYEGFTWSHASIMYNALELPSVKKLVSVGVRDWCEEEENIVKSSNGKIVVYYDEVIKKRIFSGQHWNTITDEIISNLSDKIYISFDIDGLDPKLCPNTGTPVPGGLEYYEALSLVKKIRATGRKIIGFDLVEVAPGNDEWDANVGARLVYQLSQQLF